MKRRLVIANLVIVIALLLVLEVPLAIVYSRHEHDAMNSNLQRDASSVSALAGEIIEHPGSQDVAGLARQYSSGSGAVVVVIGPDGTELTPTGLFTSDPSFRAVLDAARASGGATGEFKGLLFAARPLGSSADRGAVVVARSDEPVDLRVRRFWLLLGLLAAGVLGLSLGVSSRLGRWVVDPLRRLEEQAVLLGAGALDTRADTSSGPPEVVALAASFNDMADRLDELVRSQRRFVADASHQLRTPLTALRLRLENLDVGDEEALATTRNAALDESLRLTRLVDGLLSLARAEGRRSERVPIDIGSVVAERRDAWDPLAAEQNVDLRFVGEAFGPSRADLVPGDLEQILDNLIDNALDASGQGSTVELKVQSRRSGVEVHVMDHGAGMSEDDRAHAFDPFWQGPGSKMRGGTGLGLAIADQLARGSRGSIRLEAREGGGLDAVLRFPAASMRANGPKPPVSAVPSGPAGSLSAVRSAGDVADRT